MKQTIHWCDSCGHEADGYTRKELEADGWLWRTINLKRSFVLCTECCARYQPIWEAKAAA